MKGLSFLALLVALSGCGEKPQAASSFADAKARYDYERGELDRLEKLQDDLAKQVADAPFVGGTLHRQGDELQRKLGATVDKQRAITEQARQRLESAK